MADQEKKQVPLRISSKLYAEIAAWASVDFRSLPGHFESLLTDCDNTIKKHGSPRPENLDEGIKLDL